MNKPDYLLLRTLLSEYLRQLQSGLDAAQAELKAHVEPRRWRVWNPTELMVFRFNEPTESTPADQWHWEEYYPLHPSLNELSEVIGRIAVFVGEMAGEKEDG